MKLKTTLLISLLVGASLATAQTSTQLEFLDGSGNSKVGIGFEKTVGTNQFLKIVPTVETDKVYLNIKGSVQLEDSLFTAAARDLGGATSYDTLKIKPSSLQLVSSVAAFSPTRSVVKTTLTSSSITTDDIQAKTITASSFVTTPKWKIPDYVFEKEYKMMSLPEVERYVQQHKHLPEVPKATEIEKNGMDITHMNVLLLKKVEELTLHSIALQKQLNQQQKQIQKLQSNRVK